MMYLQYDEISASIGGKVVLPKTKRLHWQILWTDIDPFGPTHSI